MTQIAVVLGSVTPPGRLHTAVSAAVERASVANTLDLIDLAQWRLDFADGRPAEQHKDDVGRLIETISAARAVVFASPVHRGSFTGALKNLLDWLPVESLQGKPVGIVAMGATQHHHLGVDRHLRDVLAWFGALVAPTSVYLVSEDFVDGKPQAKAEEALDQLFETLNLLANATSEAKLGPAPLAARGRG